VTGCVPDMFTITLNSASKVTCELKYVGIQTDLLAPGATAKTGFRPNLPVSQAYNSIFGNRFIAGAAANGKIYVMGGFVAPAETALPLGAAWQPIDNAWQYDPVADSWKSLPPVPTKRGSAVAVEAGGKIYTIGGATTMEGRVLDDSRGRLESKDAFFTAFGPSRVLSINEVYDPATNKWETRQPMSVPRNHAFGAAVNGKIYVIGGRTGQGFILTATNTDVVEEYDPVSDTWNAPRERMPTARSGGVTGTDGRLI